MGSKGKQRKSDAANDEFKQLERLQQLFLQPHHGRDKGLTKAQFRDAIQSTVGSHLTDKEADEIFTTMDSIGKGTLSWNEYISCVVQFKLEKSNMAKAAIKPLFSQKMNFVNTKHRETIVAVRFIPRIDMNTTAIDYTRGKYIMLARDGTVSFWTLQMRVISYFFIGTSHIKDAHFFIDMVVLYPLNMVAVTSTLRSITFFQLGSKGVLVQKFQIAGVADCPTCMDYWTDLYRREKMLLVWGDTGGFVHAMEFNVDRLEGIFGKDENRAIIRRVLYCDVIRGKYQRVKMWKTTRVHHDWVSSVRYVPQYDAFISSSMCTRAPIVFTDWYGKRDHHRFDTVRPVLCFDYSYEITILVTGELDCMVRVWNFFLKTRPIAMLKGHSRPVVKVMLNVSTFHVISADKSHAVNVYSLNDYTCVQHFSGPSMQDVLGKTHITGDFYNVARNTLVLATTNVAVGVSEWDDAEGLAEVCSHDAAVVAVCYSSALDQIISACRMGFICVWEIHTGRELLQFRHYSSRNDMNYVCYEPDKRRLEVTAMCLDAAERLAITGANDGTINAWNFSTGVLLMNFATPEDCHVSSLCAGKNMIYATGWHNTVYTFDTGPNASKETKHFFRRHKDDIESMTRVHPCFLATGSYDGDIFVVDQETGHGLCSLNANVDRLPISLRSKKGEDEKEARASREESVVEDLNRVRGRAFTIIQKRGDSTPHPRLPSSDLVHDCYQNRLVDKQQNDLTNKAFESTVSCLLDLPTRDWTEHTTATFLAAGSEGWIRAWSHNPKGGLLGQFCATAILGETVMDMTTDPANEYLITADSLGYVKIWDLFNYCNAAATKLRRKTTRAREEKLYKSFIYLRYPYLSDEAAKGFDHNKSHKPVPHSVTEPSSTIKTPRLLTVFRAHANSITSVVYAPVHDLVITGSNDRSVRLHMLGGRFIGTCKDVWTNGLVDPVHSRLWPNPIPPRRLPLDIRRVASARSLKIANVGHCPLWEDAMKLVRMQINAERQRKRAEARKAAEAAEARKRELVEEMKKQGMRPLQIEQAIEEIVARERDEAKQAARAEAAGEAEEEDEESSDLKVVIKYDWNDPQKSDVLGKWFVPPMHHRPTAVFKEFELDHGQIAAYRELDLPPIYPEGTIPKPTMIREMEQKKKDDETEDERRNSQLLKAAARRKKIKKGTKKNRTNNADSASDKNNDASDRNDGAGDRNDDGTFRSDDGRDKNNDADDSCNNESVSVDENTNNEMEPCTKSLSVTHDSDFPSCLFSHMKARFDEVRKHIHGQLHELGMSRPHEFESPSAPEGGGNGSEEQCVSGEGNDYDIGCSSKQASSRSFSRKPTVSERTKYPLTPSKMVRAPAYGVSASLPDIGSRYSWVGEKSPFKRVGSTSLPPIVNAPRNTSL